MTYRPGLLLQVIREQDLRAQLADATRRLTDQLAWPPAAAGKAPPVIVLANAGAPEPPLAPPATADGWALLRRAGRLL